MRMLEQCELTYNNCIHSNDQDLNKKEAYNWEDSVRFWHRQTLFLLSPQAVIDLENADSGSFQTYAKD